jgi:addiction module HigA family antidote
MSLTQRDVAEALRISDVGLNLLLNGKKRLTASMALRLERAFGVSAQTWLNMQIACDLYAAQHSATATVIKEEVRQLVTV